MRDLDVAGGHKMGKIFINYRREDTPDAAARIHRELASTFGAKNLFMDVDNLLAGQRFDSELEKALAECDVLIVVIGPRWMSALEHRQKTSERDYVREEIAAALKRQIHIIPVLVNAAHLPSGRVLPEDICDLVKHQKHDVRHEHFSRDVAPLIEAIKLLRRPPSRRLPWSMIVAAVAGLQFLTAALFLVLPHFRSTPTPKSGETFRDCPDCPEMVVVPAGEFWMGSSGLEQGHTSREEPQHKVVIAKPFAAGKFEVTFTEWDACVSDGGCNGYRPSDEGWGRGRRPVINVSWADAKAYAAWLSKKSGETYRLLSEAEWEYAALAGRDTKYVLRKPITEQDAQFSASKTAEVGSFEPNAFGLYDMLGNVAEWVEDCWREDYKGASEDGAVLTSGDCDNRGARGGSWANNDPKYVRATDRGSGHPTNLRHYDAGFRVARQLTP